MSDPLNIPQGEQGVLRLFTLDPAQINLGTAILDPTAPTEAELAALLGTATLPPLSVEVVRLSDVAALGLRDFLIEGHDVLPEALGPAVDWLDRLTGFVLIVHPTIAADGAVQLERLHTGVAFAGAFPTGRAPPASLSLPEAEKPVTLVGPASPLGKRGAGSAALVVLVIVMILLVAFVSRLLL